MLEIHTSRAAWIRFIFYIWTRLLAAAVIFAPARDPLNNSGETVAGGSGWAARRLFAANSMVIGKKNNAADRLSPADHRQQGVMQRVPSCNRASPATRPGKTPAGDLCSRCQRSGFSFLPP